MEFIESAFLFLLYTFSLLVEVPKDVNTVSNLTVSLEKLNLKLLSVEKSSSLSQDAKHATKNRKVIR
jgi:hypothetical protein